MITGEEYKKIAKFVEPLVNAVDRLNKIQWGPAISQIDLIGAKKQREIEEEQKRLKKVLHLPHITNLQQDTSLHQTLEQEVSRKAKDLDLIKGAIKVWTDIAFNKGFSKGRSTCPLCQEYNQETNCTALDGRRCPIIRLFGIEGCYATPFGDWEKHQRERHNETKYVTERRVDCETCFDHAIAEIECLCSIYRKVLIEEA